MILRLTVVLWGIVSTSLGMEWMLAFWVGDYEVLGVANALGYVNGMDASFLGW